MLPIKQYFVWRQYMLQHFDWPSKPLISNLVQVFPGALSLHYPQGQLFTLYTLFSIYCS